MADIRLEVRDVTRADGKRGVQIRFVPSGRVMPPGTFSGVPRMTPAMLVAAAMRDEGLRRCAELGYEVETTE